MMCHVDEIGAENPMENKENWWDGKTKNRQYGGLRMEMARRKKESKADEGI